jgi:hypothetical protein
MALKMVTKIKIPIIINLQNNILQFYMMRMLRIIYKAFYFDIIDPINPLLGFI